MTDLFCMTGKQNCGCGTNFSNVPRPTFGGADLCPRCGQPHGDAVIGGGAVAATGRKVCPKCGLMQHTSSTTTIKKAGYNKLRCVDCNQLVLADDDAGTLDYCIRCGRIYDSRYAARHGNGSVGSRLVRCPCCGGNVRTYPAS